jgi:serine/threonine-protein phosphatase 2B catalytic subunit
MQSGSPDLELLQSHLSAEGVLAEECLLDLVKKAGALFEAEPNMLKLSDPITVVGDVHGQYYDLLKLLEVGGMPGDTQYIFLGDYVDRGSFSVEVVALLFAIKIKHPRRVRMLRGNHECRQMTSFFNFREECEYKYNTEVYNAIMDAFDMLPLAATINGKFFCVHGGISPELASVKAINSINRFQEPPREGLMCDLLWSDPLGDEKQETLSKSKKSQPFIENEVRGCSFFFSFEGATKFLSKNSLLSVIRAHEAQLEGYKMHKTNATTGFPSVITIFSAPNYCDVYNNKGAILKFDNSTLNILQFNCTPHPYHLPNFMDVFTWSMPFVIEKITEMLYFILNPEDDTGGEEELPDVRPMPMTQRKSLSEEQNKAVKLAFELACSQAGEMTRIGSEDGDDNARERMRNKVRTIGRMARMFKTLRQENETIVKLKGVCPGHKLPAGLLLQGKDRLSTELDHFENATELDHDNERRPEGESSSPKHTRSSATLDADDLDDGIDMIAPTRPAARLTPEEQPIDAF